jgi:uncharacterized protein
MATRWPRYLSPLLVLAASLTWLPRVAFAQEAAEAAPAPQVALYDRDENQPLNPELAVVEDTDVWTLYHLWYDSTNGERVPALLGIPKAGKAPYPALLVQHGLGGSKESDYVALPALEFAREGYVTLRIDACLHGERRREGGTARDDPLSQLRFLAELVVDGWGQSIVDMRRGLDYLVSRPEVDPTRIGYVGMSMGAMMGAVVTGVDTRIRAAVLIVGGSFGGLVQDASKLAEIDPAEFVGLISPRPLLMLNGKKDPIVPPAWAERMYEAAGEPKRIVWYDTGHYVPPEEAIKEIRAFFGEHVPPNPAD